MPKLLYVGDVPIERSFHGSLVMYRLLEDYPENSLTVVETGKVSEASRRVPQAAYHSLPMKSRWLDTRFHSMVLSWLMVRSARPETVSRLVNFEFDAVMTVVHGVGWLLAAAVARESKVPLHLIIHDDWPRVANVSATVRNWLDRSLGRAYRQASSRHCVSPFMRADYLARYGVDSQVLYPSRAKEGPNFESVPARLSCDDGRLTVAFAGTVNSEGYVQALRALSASLEKIGGRLLIFGPLQPDDARRVGLQCHNVVLCGLLSPSELIVRLRDEADVLFVPMSFDESERANMEMAFPSKLADYSATGIPFLIYGPQYCSAVRWARDNPGIAEVVEVEQESLLTQALISLSSVNTRVRLGEGALDAGRRLFAYGSAQRLFFDALAGVGQQKNWAT